MEDDNIFKMKSHSEKIFYLKQILSAKPKHYADSYKTDILFFFDDFNSLNPMFNFLKEIKTGDEIEVWVDKLTSRIVMHEDDDEIKEIIADYYSCG